MKFQDYIPDNQWPPSRWLLISGNLVYGCLAIEKRHDGQRQFEYTNYAPFSVRPLEILSGQNGQHKALLSDCIYIAQGNHPRAETLPAVRRAPAIDMKMFNAFIPDDNEAGNLDFDITRPKTSEIFNSFLE